MGNKKKEAYQNERPTYLSRSKVDNDESHHNGKAVVSGATSVGKLQCHSFSDKERETAQPQFT